MCEKELPWFWGALLARVIQQSLCSRPINIILCNSDESCHLLLEYLLRSMADTLLYSLRGESSPASSSGKPPAILLGMKSQRATGAHSGQ